MQNVEIVRPDVMTGGRTPIPPLMCEVIMALPFRLSKKNKKNRRTVVFLIKIEKKAKLIVFKHIRNIKLGFSISNKKGEVHPLSHFLFKFNPAKAHINCWQSIFTMGRGKFKAKPTGRRNFSTHEDMGKFNPINPFFFFFFLYFSARFSIKFCNFCIFWLVGML